ncbi:AI-2E family transporter [Companilactobacillus sp. RD055328]|uniref:AI-2E family transporter n=1 Tax=Companilactobacillus sp. RD055328 TaxID=2916634 RepID=UPI001FC83F24|nr:AI-2E family transporter [Companilactobacillus sp. RD055328]GKQ43076.1 AI-2E family transporter [Companilactobacillus sp. RD055328]
MEKEKNQKNSFKQSWFYRWFVNNKLTVGLLNIFLVLLIIFIFSKVSYVFSPIGQVLGIIMPTLLVSVVLYYLIDPLVNYCDDKFHINRVVTISVVFVIIFALLIWGILSFIPVLQSQIESMINHWPSYWDSFQNFLGKFLGDKNFSGSQLQEQLQDAGQYWGKKFTKQAGNIIPTTFNNLGSAVGIITNIGMVLLTAPFILFFMLKDKDKFFNNFFEYVPNKFRKSSKEVVTEISNSLSAYIRGQITVAFWVGVMYFIGYLIIGQRYGLPLAIIATVLNLIPYVGTPLALLPSLVIALFTPGMLLKVIIVFIIEQTIETRVVSPLVLGNKMQMHPVTTILVLLAAGSLFGVLGVLLGIPAYAILKIIFSKAFDWFKKRSNLYEESPEIIDEKED